MVSGYVDRGFKPGDLVQLTGPDGYRYRTVVRRHSAGYTDDDVEGHHGVDLYPKPNAYGVCPLFGLASLGIKIRLLEQKSSAALKETTREEPPHKEAP